MSSLLEEPIPQRNQAFPHLSPGPKTGCFGRNLDGVHTDLVITKYSNATLIVLTQLKKFGTVLQLTSERVRNTEIEGGSRIVYSVTTLLGKESEELDLFARVLAEKLGLQHPLLLTVGIQKFKEEQIRSFVDFITEKFKAV